MCHHGDHRRRQADLSAASTPSDGRLFERRGSDHHRPAVGLAEDRDDRDDRDDHAAEDHADRDDHAAEDHTDRSSGDRDGHDHGVADALTGQTARDHDHGAAKAAQNGCQDNHHWKAGAPAYRNCYGHLAVC